MSDSDSSSDRKSSSTQKLKGSENYHGWYRILKVKLAGKGLLEICTYKELNAGQAETDFQHRIREEPKPDERDPAVDDAATIEKKKTKIKKWTKRFNQALAYILNTIHHNIQGEFDQINDPAQLLVTIKLLYSKDEIYTEVDLREQLTNLKFEIHMPADDFFAKIQHILNRLSELQAPLSNNAKISTLLSIFRGKEFVTFKDSLMPLINSTTQYQDIVSRFKTFIRRKQEEMEIDTSYYMQGRNTGKAKRGGGSGRGSYRGRGRGGSKEGGRDSETRRCFSCNQLGHLATQCPNKKETLERLESKVSKLKERINESDVNTSSTSSGKKRATDDSAAGGDKEKEKVKKARQVC